MGNYVIEKGIPLAARGTKHEELRLLVSTMEPGDSFAFDPSEYGAVNYIRNLERIQNRRKNFRISKKLSRLWRIK